MLHKINITEQAIKDAISYKEKIGKILGKLTGTRDYNQDRDYIGYMGEWIFNEFLKKYNCLGEVKWDNKMDGIGDHGDFFFDSKIIDIKTASKQFHKNIMMPLKQFENHHSDFFVAVRLNLVEGYGEVMGYITYDELKKVTPCDIGYGLTLAVSFNKLKPINELIEQHILKKYGGELNG